MEGDVIILQDIFRYRQTGIDGNGKAVGLFEALGVRPSLTPRIESAGIHLPKDLFEERVLLEV